MRSRPDREDYAFILLLFSVFLLFWFAYAYQVCGALTTRCVLDGLKEWQALVGGALAVIAALITVWQMNRLSNIERTRRANSYQAVLSPTLSTTCEFVETEYVSLTNAEPINARDPNTSYRLTKIALNLDIGEILETIRFVLEYEDNDHAVSEKLHHLIAKLQVYVARRRDHNEPINKLNLDTAKIDCIELYAIASSLFSYSRPENHREFGMAQDELSRAVNNLHMFKAKQNDMSNQMIEKIASRSAEEKQARRRI